YENKFGEIKIIKGGSVTQKFKLPDDVLPN
ncbi:uncharacterized protein METZ01_LOCUS412816, partial [marine metagenome]